jgi:hypothetical protein
MFFEVTTDLVACLRPDLQWRAWRAALIVFGVALSFSVYYLLPAGFGLDILGVDGYAVVLAWRLPNAAISCLPVVLLPIAIVFTRRVPHATRPILVVGALVGLLVVTISLTMVVPASRTAEQYFQAAVWRGRMETTDPPRSLGDVRRDRIAPLTRVDQLRARRDNDRVIRRDVAARGASTLAFALIGIGLARRRGLRLVLWGAAVYLVWATLVAATLMAYTFVFTAGLPPGLVSWTWVAALFASSGCVLILGRNASRLPVS